MAAISAGGGLFGPGDDVERAWDEAEAILLACDDLDAVMEAIRDAESPVEARRALKFGFGFTGRQAALLLTLPVMTFTRSERRRIDENRRDRLDMLADVTGVLPAIPDEDPAPAAEPPPAAEPAMQLGWAPGPEWGAELDSLFDEPALEPLPLDSFPQFGTPGSAPEPEPEPAPGSIAAAGPSVRRSTSQADEASVVLDEQIGELCDAMADVLGLTPPAGVGADDPRASDTPSGSMLDSCAVDDATGLRTLLWHLRRTGLESVEGLFPFAEPLTAAGGFDAQAVRFEHAMTAGALGAEPAGDVLWAGRLWPIAERHGFGYAVSYRGDSGAGAVWAYGGDQPLHRMWDSVVDLLVEVYRALTEGEPCDSALAAVAGDRVMWTNIS